MNELVHYVQRLNAWRIPSVVRGEYCIYPLPSLVLAGGISDYQGTGVRYASRRVRRASRNKEWGDLTMILLFNAL